MSEPLLLTDVRILDPQLVILQEIRKRGGKMSWRWDNPEVKQLAYDLAADLCHRGIVAYVMEVSDARQESGPTFLKLTELGNRLLDGYERQKRQNLVLAPPGEEPPPGAAVDPGQ